MENKQNNQAVIEEVPVVVKIISILYYVSSGLLLIGLIYSFFIVLGRIDNPIYQFVFIPVFLLGGSILSFFIGRGLWKRDNGSRIAAIWISILVIVLDVAIVIILSVLSKGFVEQTQQIGNLNNILNIFDISRTILQSIIIIAINAFIAGYLLFNKKVKSAFIKS